MKSLKRDELAVRINEIAISNDEIAININEIDEQTIDAKIQQ